ncbi:MAG: hypothetical protein HY680_10450 [Chloroflexi bacterium]|nr:hypothetical protein [Chloroflexota bacterium]
MSLAPVGSVCIAQLGSEKLAGINYVIEDALGLNMYFVTVRCNWDGGDPPEFYDFLLKRNTQLGQLRSLYKQLAALESKPTLSDQDMNTIFNLQGEITLLSKLLVIPSNGGSADLGMGCFRSRYKTDSTLEQLASACIRYANRDVRDLSGVDVNRGHVFVWFGSKGEDNISLVLEELECKGNYGCKW